MSVSITIKHACKKYENNQVVIPDLNLKVKKGEFFTLLGPSGCGKTTLLRMISGFTGIDGGGFYFNDRLINHMDPAKRNIGMVFQNYAIFPHYTVRKNVEFGLRNKGFPGREITDIADKFLKLIQIYDLAERMPDRLSGGQQQRVALARALCVQPDVLLMDEPLSNLDAKLRVEMRSAIKTMQRNVGITTVYVTHDQEEAMAVSDRIAVMNKGIIQHIGTPRSIYQRPANMFVSSFIGRSNILNGELLAGGGTARIKIGDYEFSSAPIKEEFMIPGKVAVSIRPEEFFVQENGKTGLKAVVDDCIFLGMNTHYFMHLEDGTEVISTMESSIGGDYGKPGSELFLTVNTEKINLFNSDGSINILEGVSNGIETPVD